MQYILSCQKWQKLKFWTFQAQPDSVRPLRLFHPYFVSKTSFSVISMIKIVILYQSKPISLILKVKLSKIQKIRNLYIARLLFINTEIRQVYNPFYNWILHLLCSIIFFVTWRVKNLSTWGPGGTIQILSWKCNFSIYLDTQVYYLDIQAITTLLCLLLVLMCWLLLFIHFSMLEPLSWKVTFPALKTQSSPSFGPTRMEL